MFSKRVDYLKKFTLLFVLTGIIFSSLVITVLYYELSNFQKGVNLNKAKNELSLKKKEISKYFNDFKDFLLMLEHNRFLTTYLRNKNSGDKENLITLFKSLAEHKKEITQLRFIDINGQEIIRIDRNNLHEDIYLVKEEELQNKANRYYFKDTINKKKNEIYASKLDLNIEHQNIEIPHKPVWRFAIPVYFEGKKYGIIIVNIFAKHILENLLESNNFFIDIYDQEKDTLISSRNINHWTKYLNLKSQINKDDFIINDELFKNDTERLFIGLSVKNNLENFFEILNRKFIFLTIFIFIVSFVLAYFLSRIPKRLFDELEKDQHILLQQSKLSAMGEMTSMLAHQWRQPLNIISILLQEIEIKKSMNILSDEEFKNISKDIHDTIGHMSGTIDSFRNFYKSNKNKSNFDIEESIIASSKILAMNLKKSSIDFSIEKKGIISEDCLKINNFEDEFKQVVINIINNAIDAIDNIQNDIEPFIKVELICDKDNIQILFKDNAGGIDEKIIHNIFQPYFSTKKEKNGSGLGLYMSKMIIEKNMNGQIDVKNIDNGTCFIIKFKK